MDKKHIKQYLKNGFAENKIGRKIGILDKNGIEICVGDKVRYYNEECIVLWNDSAKGYQAMLCRSQWYGDDAYNSDSYGKCYDLPMGNGAKMELELFDQ